MDAMRSALAMARGTYAIEAIFKSEPDRIYGAKLGSPLAVGTDGRSYFMGSDAIAIGKFAKKITYLAEGDTAVITKDSIELFDRNGAPADRGSCDVAADIIADKGANRHFMMKEILEQPRVIGLVLEKTKLDAISDLKGVDKIHIVACGTSYHAGMVAKYWIESMSPVWVEVEFASEFRYRRPTFKKGELAIFISQSGETADTLAALRYAKEKEQRTLAIVNVETSTMAREADTALFTHAGPEIGVASTKAFTAQLALLARISLMFARAHGSIAPAEIDARERALGEVPGLASGILAETDGVIRDIARQRISNHRDAIYIGRGFTYPIALEGALKLKEISYIHAEGYSAGELKHGPIALIAEDVPVVALAPFDDELFGKTVSNMHEARARGGSVVFVSGYSQCEKMKGEVQARIPMPETGGFVEPLLYVLPMQLMAYHTALILGRDVDQPRNLAKSVTVE
jgi:glucosamine--fructose-6-phosphate aminotransferase (isomerizing)